MASCNVKNWSLTLVMPQERLLLISDRTALDLLTFLIRNEDRLQKLLCDFITPGTRLLRLYENCCLWSFLNFIGLHRAQHNQKLLGHCKTELSLSTPKFVLNPEVTGFFNNDNKIINYDTLYMFKVLKLQYGIFHCSEIPFPGAFLLPCANI